MSPTWPVRMVPPSFGAAAVVDCVAGAAVAAGCEAVVGGAVDETVVDVETGAGVGGAVAAPLEGGLACGAGAAHAARTTGPRPAASSAIAARRVMPDVVCFPIL